MIPLLIQAPELFDRLQRPGTLVFDVRHDLSDPLAGRRAYEAGHIPGALFLSIDSQLCAAQTGKNGRHPLPLRKEFAALMRAQGLSARSSVVIYDAGNGAMAARLWWMLRWLGHQDVGLLDGGWAAWVAHAGKVETGARSPSVSEAQAVQGLGLPASPGMPTVSADDILANLSDPRFAVIDARAHERYSGAVEPIDPVAGHIPQALNRPFSDNLDAHGRFKSPAQLRTEFQSLLGELPAACVVHQCGSGITACHNLFAMELAGLGGSALYPGSWSEWCSDPERPVATA